MLAEQPGRATTDTKLGLVVAPVRLLRETFTLWDPGSSFGEIRNQAYGYLFPMGLFHAGLAGLSVPGWITERAWSLVVVALACEGTRLVGRELGLGVWPAWFAGVAYGLSPRIVSEVGVRSAEVLPVAVLPWVLLPVVLALRGRLGPRRAALLSAAAVPFAGAVNATATVAPLALVVIFLVWGASNGRVRWSMLAWWSGLVGVAAGWWLLPLVQLGRWSPPFFDYVEDAAATTRTSGFDAAVRGASNWVAYLTTGSQPTWPAGWSLSYTPALVLATGVVAAIALLGLATFPSGWRTPLALGAMLGLACLTVGHSTSFPWQSPLAAPVQGALDHPFALLRNITKIDPVLRLPMALGLGAAMARITAVRVPRFRLLAAGLVSGLLVMSAQPVLAGDLRTAGWTRLPDAWTQAASFLARQPGPGRTWVVPGAGFAVQDWGTTMDEPFTVLGHSPWVTRSQVPLVPSGTIRMLDGLESLLIGGTRSPTLGQVLARTGISWVLVRHDLDPGLDDSALAGAVSTALHTSGGVRPAASFGGTAGDPEIELFSVTPATRAQTLTLTPLEDVRTVAGDPSDLNAAVAAGLVRSDRAAIVRGDSQWTPPADVVGDGFADRERQFGRVHQATSALRTPSEPSHTGRRVPDYPGPDGGEPVVAQYSSVTYVDASTSQGFAASFGPIRPDQSPHAALDGDPLTAWTTSFLSDPVGQWLEVHFDRPQSLTTVRIDGSAGVRRWRVSAGGHDVLAGADRSGAAIARLPGVRSRSLRITVDAANRSEPAAIAEVRASGLPARRTFIIPPVPTTRHATYLFRAAPEETTGIDRTVTLPGKKVWRLLGNVRLDDTAKVSSACTDRPMLRVDGRPVRTKLRHSRDTSTAEVRSCAELRLSAGEHRIELRRSEGLQPTAMTLTPARASAPQESTPRTMQVRHSGSVETRRVEIGPGDAALLSTRDNANPGWRATLNGVDLVPQQVDGWAQGWIVPAGRGGTVTVMFTPQGPYRVGLLAGLAVAGVLLAVALRVLLTSRLNGPVRDPAPDGVPSLTWRVRGAGAGLAWLLGGLPGFAGAMLALTLRRRPRALLVLGSALVVGGAVVSSALLLDGPRLTPQIADVLTGTGTVLLLVSALIGGAGRVR
ncbi:alpha-(1-_3)-arabinofuranosyltransferase domain-containing protein [Marmoricola sp. RAF53]|uniref:alpha-(1->3)-arabinofuranosyltransferase domain-containing protein n=1 Tax=Marmoricola sp. RAF53 TaxID=3233059 RepID=UPI003F9776F8